MTSSFACLTLTAIILTYALQSQAYAPPAGPLIKHLYSIVKWTRPTPKSPQQDGNVLQFENGYVVETVVEGNELGVIPHTIRVSQDGELFSVDASKSNIVRVTPPLSQYSRARLVAGSFQGYTGHVDGKPSDARFNHPKGVTMDDKGNVYIADTLNFAIRKIGEAGVTTIAGGKSNAVGYRDGPSEDAKFSSDFDVVYIQPTCSLLVVDRGNAALRQISLNQEDCDYQYNSISFTDVFMVIGAALVGYFACILQKGFGSSFFSKAQQQPLETEYRDQPSKEKPIPPVNNTRDEPVAGWPSFGQLIVDLSKLALEAFANAFLYFIPSRLRCPNSREGLTPLKDALRMPEDEAGHPVVHEHRAPPPLSETRRANIPITGDKYSELKPPKIKPGPSYKDPSLSSKHRSSKRQEVADYYGSGEVPLHSQTRSKGQKERTRHRQRDRSGEVVSGAEQRAADVRPVNYDGPKFEHYNIRSKYGSDDSFRF